MILLYVVVGAFALAVFAFFWGSNIAKNKNIAAEQKEAIKDAKEIAKDVEANRAKPDDAIDAGLRPFIIKDEPR